MPFGRVVRVIWRVQIAPTLHVKRAVSEDSAVVHADDVFAVRTAADGKGGVLQSTANVEWYSGVEAESFVNDGGEILHVFDVGIGRECIWVVTQMGENLGTKFRDDFGVSTKFIKCPRENCSRRVAAGKEDGVELIAQHLWVSGELGQRGDECVRLGELVIELFRSHGQDLVNVFLNECVNRSDTSSESFHRDKMFHRSVEHVN